MKQQRQVVTLLDVFINGRLQYLRMHTFAPWITDQVKRTIHCVTDSTLRFLVLSIDIHFPPAYNRVWGCHNLKVTDFVSKKFFSFPLLYMLSFPN